MFIGCYKSIMENSGWILESCTKFIATLCWSAAVIFIEAVIIALWNSCFTVPQFLFYDKVVTNGEDEKMLRSNAFIRRKLLPDCGSKNILHLYFPPDEVMIASGQKSCAFHCSLKGCMMTIDVLNGPRCNNRLSDVNMTASSTEF